MQATLRLETLLPGRCFVEPTPEEVRLILREAGLTGGEAAAFLGMGRGGSRVVRRWCSGDASIPYSAWALLCWLAGKGQIWTPKENGCSSPAGDFSG